MITYFDQMFILASNQVFPGEEVKVERMFNQDSMMVTLGGWRIEIDGPMVSRVRNSEDFVSMFREQVEEIIEKRINFEIGENYFGE